MNQIVKTSDGSHTIYVPEMNEHYHSIHGAVQESEHIFIKAGYESCNAEPLNIFEAGFGTGLNALLTAVRAAKDNREVFYTSIEKYPIAPDLIKLLNHYEFAGTDGKRIFDNIQSSPWDQMNCICNNFNLDKIKGDLTDFIPVYPVDLVYYDAFGPDKQPSMWTREIFEKIASAMRTGGILVTYSSKGEVKRNLRSVGFDVKLLPGPPGKREMISAKKI
ncbi:MAG TPA: tRNA (5-methylaminomethyl-2-thiouridine)(34)-methyltransferase MnmD [Bacteroidales bacterium]|nr:tRNA (5-methylaminomethyl-2-thiouridine)(34)-methyltransferase MnmD [Bacteroidales bacterium]